MDDLTIDYENSESIYGEYVTIITPPLEGYTFSASRVDGMPKETYVIAAEKDNEIISICAVSPFLDNNGREMAITIAEALRQYYQKLGI